MRILEKHEIGNFEVSSTSWPRHVGAIMDGNGRWAEMRGVHRANGHLGGAEAYADVTRNAAASGLAKLTLYAFSAENWSRDEDEVEFLMRFPEWLLTPALRSDLIERGARLRFIGDKWDERIPKITRDYIADTERMSESNNGTLISVAFNYDFRPELGRRSLDRDLEVADSVRALGPMDVVIRTGSETRLSGFFPSLISYSELVFTDTLWPDFRWWHFASALTEARLRQRRYGRAASTELE